MEKDEQLRQFYAKHPLLIASLFLEHGFDPWTMLKKTAELVIDGFPKSMRNGICINAARGPSAA